MKYDEFKDLCRKSWEEDYNYLYIDRSEKRDQAKYCICNESKKTYIEATPQTKPFKKHMTLIYKSTLMCHYKNYSLKLWIYTFIDIRCQV